MIEITGEAGEGNDTWSIKDSTSIRFGSIHECGLSLALNGVFDPRDIMTDIFVASSPNRAVNTERLFVGCLWLIGFK